MHNYCTKLLSGKVCNIFPSLAYPGRLSLFSYRPESNALVCSMTYDKILCLIPCVCSFSSACLPHFGGNLYHFCLLSHSNQVSHGLNWQVWEDGGEGVVLLLLLMNGDIEMNPGPVGECTPLTYCKHQVCWILKSTNTQFDLTCIDFIFSWPFRKQADLRWPWSSDGGGSGCVCTMVPPWTSVETEDWDTRQDQDTLHWP